MSAINAPEEGALKSFLQKSKPSNISSNRDSINLTVKEAQEFERAFTNKEFRKLMADYVSDISDPKHRAEQDKYIRMLESQKNIPEGRQIVRPTPGFVLKLKYVKDQKNHLSKEKQPRKDQKEKKSKLFINIVYSSKIDQPEEEDKDQASNQTQWLIPYSVGPLRMENDKSNNLVPTFDCCFHPDAKGYIMKKSGFRNLLVQTAQEGIIEQFRKDGVNVILDSDFHVLKGILYKNGTPPVMMIRDSSFSNQQNKNGKIDKDIDAFSEVTSMKKGFLLRSKTNNNKMKKSINIHPKKSYQNPSKIGKDRRCPRYTLTERKPFDISENTVQNYNQKTNNRPSHIIYRIELPGINHVADLDLDVSDERLELNSLSKENSATGSEGKYSLDLKLPYPVDCGHVTAKFDKSLHRLTVTFPVCQSS